MNIVVADDFTGSAELAGIGLRFGLKQEIHRKMDFSDQLDMLILDTDTRSRRREEIPRFLRPLLEELPKIPIDFIYKKTDSVFRGHIRLELELILKTLKLPRALLISANPSRARIIRDGIYYINEIPLHLTDFAEGFVENLFEGDVLKLLGESKQFKAYVRKPGEELPKEGIIIGEAQNLQDLDYWVQQVDELTLPAGGSDFFFALLKHKRGAVQPDFDQQWNIPPLQKQKMFFVLGSSSRYSQKFLQQLDTASIPICRFPANLEKPDAFQSNTFKKWQHCVKDAFGRSHRVAIAIAQRIIRDRNISRQLSEMIAQLVQDVVNRHQPDILLIEGGSTASAIFNLMGWQKFSPLKELSSGVVQLKVSGLHKPDVIVKPGSYQWPEEFL